MIEILSEQRASTKENVERKQARTDGEREEEEDEVTEVSIPVFSPNFLILTILFDFQVVEEEEEDDDVPYNPKNLPLGWDGKVSFFLFS